MHQRVQSFKSPGQRGCAGPTPAALLLLVLLRAELGLTALLCSQGLREGEMTSVLPQIPWFSVEARGWGGRCAGRLSLCSEILPFLTFPPSLSFVPSCRLARTDLQAWRFLLVSSVMVKSCQEKLLESSWCSRKAIPAGQALPRRVPQDRNYFVDQPFNNP